VQGGANTHDRVIQVFLFRDVLSGDFHLTGLDLGARDQGTIPPGEIFNLDIDGQTRTEPWDIGADEYVP
jgi:hypothetical protein